MGMGESLISDLAKATGLPNELIQNELLVLLSKAGVEPSRATIDDLRSILAEYVQDVLLQTKEHLDESNRLDTEAAV